MEEKENNENFISSSDLRMSTLLDVNIGTMVNPNEISAFPIKGVYTPPSKKT